MTLTRDEEYLCKYEYDFAKDGGAVGQVSLRALVNGLVEGQIVRRVRIDVITALASGGAPTLTLGNTGDPDGYLTNFFASVGTADATYSSDQGAGALISGKEYRIDSTAANQDLVIDIGVAALTAGKMRVYLYSSSNNK